MHTREAVKCCLLDLLGVRLSMWFDLAVPLAQLKPIKADRSTEQLVEDWHYWMRMGYQF